LSYAQAFWGEDVAVQRKAVACHWISLPWQSSAESIHGDFLIAVIGLQNLSDSTHGGCILVIGTPIVKRLWVLGISIARSKVNRNLQTNLTASENIIQEALFLFDLDQ